MVTMKLLANHEGKTIGSLIEVDEATAGRMAGEMKAVRVGVATNYFGIEHRAIVAPPETRRIGRPRKNF